MEAYLGAPESYDSVDIEGSPRLSMKIAGGIHGDVATASIVVNSIPKVLNAPPGLHTMRDLPLPSFFSGEVDSRSGRPEGLRYRYYRATRPHPPANQPARRPSKSFR